MQFLGAVVAFWVNLAAAEELERQLEGAKSDVECVRQALMCMPGGSVRHGLAGLSVLHGVQHPTICSGVLSGPRQHDMKMHGHSWRCGCFAGLPVPGQVGMFPRD